MNEDSLFLCEANMPIVITNLIFKIYIAFLNIRMVISIFFFISFIAKGKPIFLCSVEGGELASLGGLED